MTLTTPELPDGYFFRVTKNDTSESFPYRVTLRKEAPNGSEGILASPAQDATDIHRAMCYLKWENDRRQNQRIDPNLLGDYPPKTLEGQR